ncbi:MAG: hypothetical protein G01um1014106_701, partial [Parcubacteria group bacterium Gr01-1014_106]
MEETSADIAYDSPVRMAVSAPAIARAFALLYGTP